MKVLTLEEIMALNVGQVLEKFRERTILKEEWEAMDDDSRRLLASVVAAGQYAVEHPTASFDWIYKVFGM